MAELPPPQDDGLIYPPVGSWSRDKHHFLARYVDMFTSAMKGKFALHYIDLFAGAGIENVKGVGLEWGSPLIAAQAKKPFDFLHLCEEKTENFAALQARVEKYRQPNPPQLICGDANKVVGEIALAIPPNKTLSLAFLDPFGLHLHYETLRRLTSGNKRIDLLIYFPDAVDVDRNIELYAKQAQSNLCRVLGTKSWRSRIENQPSDRWKKIIRDVYFEQIGKLGYEFRDSEPISKPDGTPLYQLLFCSRHKLGAKFWNEVVAKKRDQQTSFKFPDPD
jgi:three-Cys-motif partner protein